jgi:hypothetical protein
MVDCDHCGDSFDDDDAYARHLADAHDPDELSRIERRRVENLQAESAGNGLPVSTGVVLVGVVAVVAVLGGATLVFGGSGGSSDGGETRTPTNLGSVHYHGQITMVVDGRTIDFSRPQYQLQSDFVHFEGGNGRRWHAHSQGVTIEYFMSTLGFQLTENRFSDGETTVTDDSGVISIRVNGRAVDPRTYVLQPEDDVVIRVAPGDS